MMPTAASSMASPTRAGITTPNRMIALPTASIVSVCPMPQAAPIRTEPRNVRCR